MIRFKGHDRMIVEAILGTPNLETEVDGLRMCIYGHKSRRVIMFYNDLDLVEKVIESVR